MCMRKLKKDCLVVVRVTKKQKKSLQAAAAKRGHTLSSWLLTTALEKSMQEAANV